MSIDYSLFEWLNQSLATPWLDAALPIYREKTTWIPLYAILLFLLVRNHGWRPTLYLLLTVGVVITVADQLAAEVIKPGVGRLRPCATPAIAESVRSLVGCGGKYSFPSNHATNHFAIATLLSMTLFRGRRWASILLFVWAATISVAQVYVGKHWPLDIVAGALFGTGLACLGVVTYHKLAGPYAINSLRPGQTRYLPSSPIH